MQGLGENYRRKIPNTIIKQNKDYRTVIKYDYLIVLFK